jgi:hypothetical protein
MKSACTRVATAPIAFAAFRPRHGGRDFDRRARVLKLTLRISGTLMALGITLSVVVQIWPAVILGFFNGRFRDRESRAHFVWRGRAHENGAGAGLATVTTLGYFGFLSGPSLIGALAAVGLPFAFMTVVAFGVVIATLGVSVIGPSLRMINGGREKTIELAKHYRNLARFLQIAWLDAGEIVSTDGVDGIHFSEGNNLAFGQAVARLVGSEILPLPHGLTVSSRRTPPNDDRHERGALHASLIACSRERRGATVCNPCRRRSHYCLALKMLVGGYQ